MPSLSLGSTFEPLAEQVELYRRYLMDADAQSATGLRGYLKNVIIDSAPRPSLFSSVIEPWQRPLYNLICPLIERAAGFDVKPPGQLEAGKPWGAFITMPRGHSKTSTLAHLLAWALIYSKRKMSCYAAAADGDQAAIMLERLEREKACNRWMAKKLKRSYYRVAGPAGYLKVLSSEAPSASGLHGDLFVLDEVVWWRSRDLYDILLSGWNKRPHAAFIVLTNAGVLGTWQHALWEEVKQTPQYWVTYEVPGTVASWIDKQKLSVDRRQLPPALAARLFDNQWQGEMGEYLARADLEACVDRSMREADRGEPNLEYVFSTDYGATKDRATAAVTHFDPVREKVVLDRMWIHQGTPGKPTPLSVVDAWADEALERFSIREAILDPYQLEALAQRLEVRVEVTRFSFASMRSGSGHHALAENLRSLVLNRRLLMPPHMAVLDLPGGRTEDLIDEISCLVIEVTSGRRRAADGAIDTDGVLYRANHVPGKHDDRYTSLSMGALAANRRARLGTPLVFGITKQGRRIVPVSLNTDTYVGVQFLPSWECWAAMVVWPVGTPPRSIPECRTSDEAAWIVNEVARRSGEPEPNRIPDGLFSDERLVELREMIG